MKRAIILITLAMCAALLHATLDEQWTATYAPDGVQSFHGVCVNDAGHTFAAGFSTFAGRIDTDGLVVALDEDGNQQWAATLGESGWDYFEDVCPAPDGGCVAVGWSNTPGTSDAWAIALDAGGQQQWQHMWGGDAADRASSILPLEGGYLVCGSTGSYGLGEEDVWLLRLDASGDTLWTATYGSEAFDRGYDAIALPDGSFFIVGTTNQFNATRNAEVLLLKVSASGEELARDTFWVTGSGPVDYDAGFAACLLPDGTIMLTGCTAGEGVEMMDIVVAHVNTDLDVLDKARFELQGFYEFGYAVVPSVRTGGGVIGGTARRSSDLRNAGYLMCVDETMNLVWSEVFEADHDAAVYGLADAGGDIVWCGWQRTGSGQSRAIVQRLCDSFLIPGFESTPSTGHAPLQGVIRSTCGANPPVNSIEWDTDGDGVFETTADSVTFSYAAPGYHTIGMRVSNGGEPVELVQEDYLRVFDGNSCVGFSPNASLAHCEPTGQLHQQETLTVEAWIRPDGWGENTLLGGRVADKASWGMFVCSHNNALGDSCLCVYLRTEGAAQTFGATPSGSISLGQWQHVAFSYSAADGAHAYINGQERPLQWTIAPTGALLPHSDEPLQVGNNTAHQAGFDGLIDEVRVWNCVRTATEIHDGMSQPIAASDVELVAYFQMDEGNGEVCEDNSVWEHDLLLQDTGWWQGTPFEPTPVSDGTSAPRYAPAITSVAPNPFNPSTRIGFSLPEPGATSLVIYDIRGRRVRTLVHRHMPAGNHAAVWDGRTDDGRPVASGVYFARLLSKGNATAHKLVLLK